MTADMHHKFHLTLRELCGAVPSFGAVVQSIRRAKQRNQLSVALRVHRATAWVSEVENDNPPKSLSLNDVASLAEALDCHPSEKAQLIEAFVCYQLRKMGIFDDLSTE